MSIVSMSDLLKDRKRSGIGRSRPDSIKFRYEVHKSGVNLSYLSFNIGQNIIEQAGWKKGDFVNLLWDADNRRAFLESATASTGRVLSYYGKKSTRMIVRFPFVQGHRLPTNAATVEAYNIKTKRTNVSFYLPEDEE